MVLLIVICFPSCNMVMGVRPSCPDGCQCALLKDWSTAATCHFSQQSDYSAMSELPKNTSQLTCIIKGTFDETELDLTSLGALKKLVLRPDVYKTFYTAKQIGKVSKVERPNLLSNLTRLEHLGIHILVSNINPRVFDPVPDLVTLDLSYSMLDVHGILPEMLHNMNFSGRRLQNLIVRDAQRRHTSIRPETLLLRDHIYKNIQNYPLTTLDLLNNYNVALQAGVTTYAPQLEALRIGSGGLLYVSEEYPNSRACFNAELYLQNYLHELVLDFPRSLDTHVPRHVRSPLDVLGKNFWTCAQGIELSTANPSLLCSLVKCICQGVVTIPCESLLDVAFSDVFNNTRECYGHVQIPFSPSLETLVLRNFPLRSSVGSNMVLCISPRNRLKHLVLSVDIGSPTLLQVFDTSGVNVTGLQKLEFCN